jgi:serine protease Do
MSQIRRERYVAAALGVSAVVIGAVAFAQHIQSAHASTPAVVVAPSSTPGSTTSAVASGELARLNELSDAFATVAARVKPSVVFITTRTNASTTLSSSGRSRQRSLAPSMPGLPPELAPFFRDFPNQPMVPDEPRGGRIGAGSGFIVSADGYVLTNNHVVEGADKVTVRLLDRREFDAKVVGRDPNTDVAVLKINATDLSPAVLGNIDATRVGEWVLAVGNPLGENLSFTVTQGIVSAKGRGSLALPSASARSIQDFIQTDAAINPGNSGGPLVNVRGEVIGINSAIASPTGYNTGYGFAVPINLARAVMDQIVKTGHVERAALGITARDATSEDATYAGLPHIAGVVVQDFASPNAPARRAGIEPGDVIVAVDGKPVEYVAQLQEAVAFHKPGDVVSVDIVRKGGQRFTRRITLERVESADATNADEHARSDNGDDNGDDVAGTTSVPSLGVSVAPSEDAASSGLRLPADVRGAVVVDVTDAGPAQGRLFTAAMGGPDVILSVEGTPVPTPAELRDAIRKHRSGEIVTLQVYNARSGQRRIERMRLGS